MKTVFKTVYQFSELSKEGKERAKREYYEHETYDFLSEDITEDIKNTLQGKGVTFEEIKPLYSLSYSQGDGLCFTGKLTKGNISLILSHSYRYYFAKSVTMEFVDAVTGDEIDRDDDLVSIYLEVCHKAERLGYDILEYRMTDDEFSEMSDSNGWYYTEKGSIYIG